MKYEVIVGNVGSVYSGRGKFKADEIFRCYIIASKDEQGRASGEPVTLLANGEILRDYHPERFNGNGGGVNSN